VFDFDGVILETEGPEFVSWRELWREHGEELPVTRYLDGVGSSGFDPCAELCARVEARGSTPPDPDALRARQHERWYAMLASARPMAGVERCLEEARALGLPVAVASSSSRAWVEGHLVRLGLRAGFARLFCRDDVRAVKPDPELYLAALAAFGVAPRDALAFEDSRNGVTAATRAGIRCAAVPTELTRGLDLAHADLRLSSLEDALPLADFLRSIRGASALP
jgi:HAD superfamily hydrolase (TIGR01509 family)